MQFCPSDLARYRDPSASRSSSAGPWSLPGVLDATPRLIVTLPKSDKPTSDVLKIRLIRKSDVF